MQPSPLKLTLTIKKDENGSFGVKEESGLNVSTSSVYHDSTLQQPINVSSSAEEENYGSEDEDNQSCEYAQNQLVLYDPTVNGTGEIEAVLDPIDDQPLPLQRHGFPYNSNRVLPSVGAFTVQCAICFKWRLIPTKEIYEKIREHILEHPFVCETAREWRSEVSCDDPADISQDGSRLWAIDKPNIAQPPPGWERLLRIRGEGSTKFADVYYVAPSGKRLRSMVEIHRYLLEHPGYVAEGITMSQFSFQTPKPLQENYVRKRPRLPAPYDGSNLQTQGLLEPPSEVNPIAWAGPDECTELQLGGPGLSTAPYPEARFSDPANRPAKKQARTPQPPQLTIRSSNLENQHRVEEPHHHHHHQARHYTFNL